MDGASWHRRVDQLPTALAVALRLQAAGHSEEVIGTALGVPVEGVAALLHVARAKLDNLPGAAAPSQRPASCSSGPPRADQ